MKKLMPYAFAAAMLALGACNSENKPVETTAQDNSPSGDTAVVIRDNADPEAMYRARARRIADRVYTDLQLKDTTYRTRLATVYMGRARRLGGLRQQYQTDTTGQYQAMRQAEMESEKELQTQVFTDPTVYKSYETHSADYRDEKYMDTDMTASEDMNTAGSAAGSDANAGQSSDASASSMSTSSDKMATGAMEGDKAKMKVKGEDGSKIKMKKGDVKYKDANGEKTKVNGD